MNTALPTTLPFPEQLQTIKSYMGKLGQADPAAMGAFSRLHEATSKPGALDTKTKELIALAIGVALRCDGCIAFHTHDALETGASEQEILDALGVAIMMGGGPSGDLRYGLWSRTEPRRVSPLLAGAFGVFVVSTVSYRGPAR
jgi:AhpD family alkylhydroperoxidase